MNLFDTTFLASQVTWTGLSFFLLLGVMWKFVLPAITKVLDERARQVQNDLDGAAKMRDDAEKTLAEYQKQLAAAREEATEIVATARSEAQAVVEARTTELEEELSRKMAAAEAKIAQTQSQAMQEIQSSVADMVVLATEKVIGESVDAKKAEKITGHTIKTLLN